MPHVDVKVSLPICVEVSKGVEPDYTGYKIVHLKAAATMAEPGPEIEFIIAPMSDQDGYIEALITDFRNFVFVAAQMSLDKANAAFVNMSKATITH